MAQHNKVSSPMVPFTPPISNPPEQLAGTIIGSAPRPARMSSPLDPPNSNRKRANVNNEHDHVTDKGFGQIPPGR